MNDRIKELIAQAEVYALDEQSKHNNDEDYECSFEDDFAEKLVHLVVWECASIYGKIHNVDIDSDEYIQTLNKAFWEDEE